MKYLTIFIEQLKDSVYHVWIQCLTCRDANSSLEFLCKRNKIKYGGVSLLRKLREKPRRQRPKGKTNKHSAVKCMLVLICCLVTSGQISKD